MMGYGFGMGLIGMLFYLLVIIGVIYLVIKLVADDVRMRRNEKPAEKILAERFARGEITDEEYIRMKGVLRD